MDTSTLGLLLHALHLDAYLPVALAVVAVASALAAVLPRPAAGSKLAPLRAALDLVACNVGQAKNAPITPPAV